MVPLHYEFRLALKLLISLEVYFTVIILTKNYIGPALTCEGGVIYLSLECKSHSQYYWL